LFEMRWPSWGPVTIGAALAVGSRVGTTWAQ
jgi:hypothetical protein